MEKTTSIVSEKLNEYLKDHHIDYEVLMHSRAYTAQETAEAIHFSGKSFIKPVMLKADGRKVMAAIPADGVLDYEYVRDCLEIHYLGLLKETEFPEMFGECEPGAMPPFGNLYGIPLYLDSSFKDKNEVFFNAGTHRAVIRMKSADYVRLADPQICPLIRTDYPLKYDEKKRLEKDDQRRAATMGEQDRHFRFK